jgi:glycosyltransferase involved in cell wall biosynthesis
MRIGFDVSQTGTNKAGCGYYADSLVRNLVEIDPDDEFILYPTFGNGAWDATWPRSTIRLHRRNVRLGLGHRIANDLDAFWRTPPSDLEHQLGGPDVIHSNNYFCPSTIQRARIVYTLHDLAFVEHPEWSTEPNRLTCFGGAFAASLEADHVVAVSEYTRRHFLATFPHYPPERVSVVYQASRFPHDSASHEHPARLRGLEPHGFWLAVSTLEPRKNLQRLVRAYCRLASELGARQPLVLAGGRGWLADQLEQELAENVSRGRVVRLGYVTDAELEWLYANCFAFVFPSLFEGFGLPVVEAMSLGAPVVVSNAASLPEVVGEAGLQVDPLDEEALFIALRRLTRGEVDRGVLRQRSLARAREFSWRRAAEQVLDVYRTLRSVEHGAWRRSAPDSTLLCRKGQPQSWN